MNTMSASPAEAPRRILVWDAPVRVVHWLIAFSFAGAWITAESERWRLVHVTLGYTLGALVLFRIVWGFVGPRHARFASFVHGPGAVGRYLRSLFTRTPEHHVGHNPAAGWAIVALLGLGLGLAVSGHLLYDGLEALEDLHEGLANALLALVVVHVAAVLLSSRLHHENLVGAMLSGRKLGPPRDAIRQAWRTVAVLLLAAVLGFWWLQWRDAPAGGLIAGAPVAAGERGGAHDDDD